MHRPPADRKAGRVSYYPGEVAQILKLTTVDYHQLRRFFEIIDPTLRSEAERGRKKWTWTRYTFRHIVALRTALRLAGHESGQRLDIQLVRRACAVLRDQFARTSPLTDTQLSRLGDTIVARIGGKLFDAATGQRLITEVAMSVREFVESHCDDNVATACLRQVKEHTSALAHEVRAGHRKFSVLLVNRGAR